MRLTEAILENPLAYRLWQAPFAQQKFAPLLAHNDLARVRRVLDVGCGPGTNARFFSRAAYLGIDINPLYITSARRRHRGDFQVADATTFTAPRGERFDFILLNSFLHHIDTPDARRLLSHLASLLTEDGHVHILDAVLPDHRSVALLLAHRDRGEFFRPLDEWRKLFTSIFDPVVFEPYDLTGLGTVLWKMVYFKGRVKK